ncbi:phosphoesterase [Tepiditoga spiralis]|uniref:Phosphoesterase n=1 Tax=Tepiditoga spiralis TaxID=2108365 RepID=A0A7G1G4L5_9BACT|nr:metallophosphoesterase family protein [Tepiditoga spiralis]BBE31468.1 phosphoesterase [Tepiditoga spiralis]
MKIAFISDIHGNIEALNSILNDIEKQNIDKIYSLGDLVGYGPNPNEVVEKIRELKIQSVMGNYDDAVGNEKESCGCTYNPGRETEVGDESISWTIKNTSSENKNFLKNLPKKLHIEFEGLKILLVHGSPLNELLEYVKPNIEVNRLNELVNSVNEDIIINGHTHISMEKNINGKTVYNAGSVGRTKEGIPEAVYLIIDINNGVYSHEFRRIKYDTKKTCEKIINTGLPIELALVIALGSTYNMGNSKKRSIKFKL